MDESTSDSELIVLDNVTDAKSMNGAVDALTVEEAVMDDSNLIGYLSLIGEAILVVTASENAYALQFCRIIDVVNESSIIRAHQRTQINKKTL
ncbi:MAG: hypothetical protein KBS81_11945 [Spirochaetales bacterium]|nr:hypothetical protein [Candidatus Physcosoma equi]